MPELRPGPQPGRWVLSHGEIRNHRVRAHAGDVPRRAQSDHRRHRPAHHRARFSRFRTPAVDRYSIPAEFDRGRALYGKLSDIYGRRAMMLASIGIFVAGSAACAAAQDMIMLILAVVCRGSAAAVFSIGASDSCRRGRAPRARAATGLYGERLGYPRGSAVQSSAAF